MYQICLISNVLHTTRSSVPVRRSWRERPSSRSLTRSSSREGNSSWPSEKSTCSSENSTSSFSSSTRINPMSKNGRASLSAVVSNSKTATASAYLQVGTSVCLQMGYVCGTFVWSCLCLTDFQHKITVQASPTMDKRRSLNSTNSSPPSSPTLIPRLRAIQCKFPLYNTCIQHHLTECFFLFFILRLLLLCGLVMVRFQVSMWS